MPKMESDWTEAININHFCAHIREEALQTFRNKIASNKKTLDDVLIVFRRKYVKPESTAKLKWQKLTSDTNTKSLSDFLEELNECAKKRLLTASNIWSTVHSTQNCDHIWNDCSI